MPPPVAPSSAHFAWPTPPASMMIDCTHANYLGRAGGTDYCVQPGVGNMLDTFMDGYGLFQTCTDCATSCVTVLSISR